MPNDDDGDVGVDSDRAVEKLTAVASVLVVAEAATALRDVWKTICSHYLLPFLNRKLSTQNFTIGTCIMYILLEMAVVGSSWLNYGKGLPVV